MDKVSSIDYKDVARLRRHLSERGKIEPRRKTGTCARHQRALAVALKRARHVALLPYTAEHIRMSGMVLRSPDDRRSSDRGPRFQRPQEAPSPVAAAAAAGAPGADGAVAATPDGAANGTATEAAPAATNGVEAESPAPAAAAPAEAPAAAAPAETPAAAAPAETPAAAPAEETPAVAAPAGATATE